MVELVPIVAAAANDVIGAGNRLPWRIPDDLRRFKALTTGHPVIMGRRTFESIGRALPGRLNIVVTRNPRFAADGVETAASLAKAALKAAARGATAYVIGGVEMYREAFPFAERIHLTAIDRVFEGDAKLPPLDPRDWIPVSAALGEAPAAAGHPPFRYAFVELRRRRAGEAPVLPAAPPRGGVTPVFFAAALRMTEAGHE